jgi:putative membrane protein
MLTAVVERNLLPILIFGCGGILGLVFFARVLRWLLRRFHDVTVAALIGLMAGSLRKIWPWKETVETFTDRHGELKPLVEANVLPASLSGEVLLSIGLGIAGCAIVVVIERLATRRSAGDTKD